MKIESTDYVCDNGNLMIGEKIYYLAKSDTARILSSYVDLHHDGCQWFDLANKKRLNMLKSQLDLYGYWDKNYDRLVERIVERLQQQRPKPFKLDR